MGTGTIATTTEAEIVPTPRHLMENSPPNDSASSSGKRSADSDEQSSQKKHRRSSKEVQRAQANVVMKTKKESTAMKVATKRIVQNKALTREDPNWKSISRIVEEVNELCDSNISPKTTGNCVLKGLIDTSPKKRGPSGKIPKPVYEALKGAYSTYLMLEQAESKKQPTLKDLSQRVNACVNNADHNITRDDLTHKLRRDTSDLFTVGKANVIEQRRLMWTTHFNLDLWFTTWKQTLIDLGFSRARTEEDVDAVGEIVFFDKQLERIVNLDETDGTLDESH